LLELPLRRLERAAAARAGGEQQPRGDAGGDQQHEEKREGGEYQYRDGHGRSSSVTSLERERGPAGTLHQVTVLTAILQAARRRPATIAGARPCFAPRSWRPRCPAAGRRG